MDAHEEPREATQQPSADQRLHHALAFMSVTPFMGMTIFKANNTSEDYM
jgi:hypothetical protein